MSQNFQNHVKCVKKLFKDGFFDQAYLDLIALGDARLISPYLLQMEAALIQLSSEAINLELEDAEKCLLDAFSLNKTDIGVLSDLAHFYDVVLPDAAKASEFALLALERLRILKHEMERVKGV